MRRILFLGIILAACLSAYAQDSTKSWSDWSKKDAEKVLNDSAWGQTYTERPAERTSGAITGVGSVGASESGEGKSQKPVHYRGRFLSAKPIREGFARIVTLLQPNASAELKGQLQGFVDRDFGDYLVVAFAIESEDEARAKASMMMMSRLTTDILKDKVYLERKDGKRATLLDYKAPTSDGMGAKFIFSRTLDGAKFLSDPEDTAKFFLGMNERMKVTLKFKVSGMTYGGKLEY